jgi:hypothetical protein
MGSMRTISIGARTHSRRTSLGSARHTAPAIAAAILLALSACGSDYVERKTQAVFDPSDANDFWAQPFPSDLRLGDDGGYGFIRWPQYGGRSPVARTNELLGMWLQSAEDRVRDGWGVSSGVFVPVSAPIDPATLPATPEASLATGASAFLVDIDAASPERGQRRPVRFSFRATGDRYAPPNLIAGVQVFGFPRRARTKYALVVTDQVKDASGEPLGRSKAFHDAMKGDGPYAATYAPMIETLKTIAVDPASVVGAAVLTTNDPEVLVKKIVDWAERQPVPQIVAPFTVAEDHESFQVLTTEYEVPVIQNGLRPYERIGEGRIVFGADGDPVIQDTQRVRMSIAIPKRPMPASGFPLTMYLHGSGGEWYEPIDRSPLPLEAERGEFVKGRGPAEWLARRGIATIGFDFPIHGNRNDPPDTTGLVFYNLFGNTDATIDNFHVATMELMLLSRLVLAMQIDAGLAPTLDAGGAADGKIKFDPDHLTAMGHSMGQTLGVAWVGYDPRVKAFYASGGGGTLIEVAVNTTYPITLRVFLEGAIEFDEDADISIDHPVLHALQHVWDFVDPTVRARRVVQDPPPGIPPKHILMTLGWVDGYFSPGAQSALAAALGVPMVGAPVEPTVIGALDLAGLPHLEYPVMNNVNGKTAASIAYQVPFELGHYVAFDLESTRSQYTCFLQSVGPTGARLSAAQSLDDPCP